jgi:hypothetical protein
MQRQRLRSVRTALRVGSFAAVVWAGLALNGPARAIDVQINIGNAPPPPTFVFHRRPREVFDPTSRVYVVNDPGVGDDDCFRYGGYYWVFRSGYWYRSSNWRGHFVVVEPRYVPTVIYRVPGGRWKHRPSGPPGLEKKPGGMPPGQYKKEHGGGGRGHGR